MRYSELFRLKYQKGFSTQSLRRLYPAELKRINEIALINLDETTLQQTLPQKKIVSLLIHLKRRFHLTNLTKGNGDPLLCEKGSL